MSDNKQPTILVKKADGTKVRVTLDEFRKMKSRQQEVNNERKLDWSWDVCVKRDKQDVSRCFTDAYQSLD